MEDSLHSAYVFVVLNDLCRRSISNKMDVGWFHDHVKKMKLGFIILCLRFCRLKWLRQSKHIKMKMHNIWSKNISNWFTPSRVQENHLPDRISSQSAKWKTENFDSDNTRTSDQGIFRWIKNIRWVWIKISVGWVLIVDLPYLTINSYILCIVS